MKRPFLSGLIALLLAHTASAYVNDAVVDYPLSSVASDIQIDDVTFLNNGFFRVLLPTFSEFPGSLYETSSTLNYTNRGHMIGGPGFDLRTYPATTGVVHMAANFVNQPNGVDGGLIECTGFNTNFFVGGGVGGLFFFIGGNSKFIAEATNMTQSGSIALDNSGLIRLKGENVDLSRGILSMPGITTFSNTTLGVVSIDYGIFQNTNFWDPSTSLGPSTALSSPINTITFPPQFFPFGALQMFLSNSTPYFFIVQTGPSNFVTRAIFLQDNALGNVSKNVYFESSGVGAGAAHIEWVGTYTDPLSGLPATNYFYLSDLYIRATNAQAFNGVPDNYTFAQGPQRLILGTPATAAFVPIFLPGAVTNRYAYVDTRIIPTLTPTNAVAGGNPTNLLGRVEISASGHLNLESSQILGPNYVGLAAPHQFDGNAGAKIMAPFADLNLGVTNGFLTLSNLLVPELPSWSGAIQAWTTVWLDTDTNTGITNDFRILLVNSTGMTPTTPIAVQDLILTGSNSVTVSDSMNILRKVLINTVRLTLTTNDAGAMSTMGALKIQSPNIFWSPSLPDLQYFTNFGVISTPNLANFAHGMTSPFTPRSAATPYQTFVNHGFITNRGTFVLARYVENGGLIQESDFSGDLEVQAICATLTNGVFSAPTGFVSIACNNLITSNHVLAAGRALTLSLTNCLFDANIVSNQFGHLFTTNTPPNDGATNQEIWQAGAGFNLLAKPTTGDLLGTTVTNVAQPFNRVFNVWAGADRGASPNGFADNVAIGRLVLDGGTNSIFSFQGSDAGNHALYVDTLEFRNYSTNRNGGAMIGVEFAPNMRIYYAEAISQGESIAEKLAGNNNGHFLWVSNYAGPFSSTNITYPDGNTYIFNRPLVQSTREDSDNDFLVNAADPSPIPTNVVFDVSVSLASCQCDDSIFGTGTGDPGDPGDTNGTQHVTSLKFPARVTPASGGPVSFALVKGSYSGLFYETNGVTPQHAGYFTASTTPKGAFSAKLQLGASLYSFTGSFDATGNWSGSNVTGKGLPTLTVELHLNSNEGGQIAGRVAGSGWSADLLANRDIFGGKNPAQFAGKYTFAIPGSTNASSPNGDGFATITADASGGVNWSGTLADGAKMGQKTAVSKDGIWPFYSSLYGGAGTVLGWLQFTNGVDTDVSGDVLWIATAGAPGSLYSAGFTNRTSGVGSRVSGNGSPGFVTGFIDLSGGPLTSTVSNSITLGSGNKLVNPPPGLTLSITVSTGAFKGTALNTGTGESLAFSGVLLQKQHRGAGFFLNSNRSGDVEIGPAP